MFTPSGIVTILTDFGTRDTYVGQMKGVMLGRDNSLIIVDLTHEIPPQDVLEGAFQLATAVQAWPPGTVHLAVVDPGVGTERRAIAIQSSGSVFIGPDNGLLSLALPSAPERVVELSNPELHRPAVTSTFHGRDIFAPVAAAVASGRVDVPDLGRDVAVDGLVRLNLDPVAYGADDARGAIVSIDRFGNCLTMIDPDRLAGLGRPLVVECRGFRAVGVNETYADQPEGMPVALIGSHGELELAVRGGNASETFRIRRGDMVTVGGSPMLSSQWAR